MREALTEREREGSQLMLAISLETVRAHNKHLYAKLSINSQSELFALVWQGRR